MSLTNVPNVHVDHLRTVFSPWEDIAGKIIKKKRGNDAVLSIKKKKFPALS